MPVTKSAEKALRNQARKAIVNQRVRSVLRSTLKEFNESKKATMVAGAYRAIDKAAKMNIIHKNKAARLKSQVTRKVV